MKQVKAWFQKKLNAVVKVMVFAVKEFRDDRCDLRASSLTLFTLLSIVPVMAMAFGIAKGFGFKEFLENQILELFAGQEAAIQNILTFSNNLLEKTKGGVMAVLGVMLLFYSLIKLIGHIENAFNKIWWVNDDRPLIRKFTDYIAISITAGILIILSSSGNIFIAAFLKKFLLFIQLPEGVEKLISLSFNIFAFFPIWILFIFFYTFIPNKRPDIKAVVAGGLLAGTGFQVVQMTYLNFQVILSSYNAVYGSFAALPLFLIWLNASWTIFLFGAEVAFSWENIDALETRNIDYSQISIRLKKLVVLRIVHLCVARFVNGRTPATDIDIAAEIKIPLKIVKVLLNQLIKSRVLLEVAGQDHSGYVPARDVECLSITDVLDAFENWGSNVVEVADTLEYQALEKSLDAFSEACKASSGQRNLKDI